MSNEIETIGLGMDTSGVEKGIKALDVLAGKGAPVEKAMAGVETAAAKTGKSLANLGAGAGKGLDEVASKAAPAAAGLNKVDSSADAASKSVKSLGGAGAAGLDALNRAASTTAAGMRGVGTASAAADKGVRGLATAANEVTTALRAEAAALTGLQSGMASLNAANAAAAKSAQDLAKAMQSASEQTRGIRDGANTGSAALGGLRQSAALAAQAFAAIGIGSVVKEYFQAADAVTTLNNSLRLATGGTQNAALAYEALFNIAQRSRVGFLELGGTFASISRATGELGVSQGRMLKVTESIANAMTIGGGSAQSMNAALVQLSQGMASGTLRGEELNSILEQAPRLAKALADGLGVPIGKLREMGQAGEITSQQIVRALESQSEVLSKEVTTATLTLGQAFTQLSNSGTKAIGEFDKASGASTSLAQAISAVSVAVDGMGRAFADNKEVIQSVMGAITGAAVLVSLAAIPKAIAAIGGAITGLGVALAANPAVLALLGIGAVAGGGLAAVNAYSKTKTGIEEAIAGLESANERSEAALQRALAGGRTAGADNIRKTIEERRKAIRDLNAEIALMNNAGLDNRAEEARLAAGTEQFRAQQRAAEELAGIKQKLSGVDKDYLPTLNKLYQQYKDGNLSLKEYQGLVAKLAEDNYKASAGSKAAASAVKAEQDAYRNLVTSIKEKIAANELELSNAQEMTDSQRILIKLDQELLSGKLKLTAANERDIRSRVAILALQEKEIAARREAVKVAQAVAAARTKETEGIEAWMRAQEDAAIQSTKSITDRIAGLADEEDAVELARQGNISLAEAIERVAIARLREKRDSPTGVYEDSQEYQRLTKEIELREKLAQGIGNKDTRERNDDAIERARRKAQDELNRYIEDTQRGLGDAIEIAITDGSKAGGERMREVLQEALLRKPLRMLIDGVLNQVTGGALNLLLGGTAQAVAGVASGGSALGTLGSAASGLSALGGTFGMGLRAGLSGLFGEAGLAGTLSAGTTAISAGNIAGGLGTLAGPLALLGGGILVLNSLIKSTKGETRTGGQFGVAFDGSVTNARRDQTYTYQGQQFDRDFSNGQRNPLVNGQAYRLEGDPIAGQESTIRNAVSGTAKTINTLLEKYGSSVSLTAFSAGLETSGKGRGGVFAGGTLSNGATFGESGRGDNYQGTLYEQFSSMSPDGKAALEAFTLDLQQSALQALQKATDLPKYVSRVLADVDVESLGAEEVAALLQQVADLPNQLLQGVGLTRDALVQQFAQGLATGDAAAAGQSVADTLVAGIESSLYTTAAGRIFDIVNTGIIAPMIDAITTGATLSEVLSEASIDRVIENATRQAAALDALFKDERFVELLGRLRTGVGSALGAAGAAFNYAPQYQQLANSTGAAAAGASSLTDAVDELTKAYDSAIKSLTGDRDRLAVDMLRAQGRESDAKALERSQYLAQFANLDAGRLQEISTLYDLNEATRKEVDALNERKSLQDELNSLTETNSQALKRQRDALSDSNKALFDQVQALKLQAELASVASMYMTPQQRQSVGYESVAADLRAEGFADVTGKALERLSKNELAGLLTTIYNLGTTTDSTRLVLLRAAGALGTLKDQAVDMAAAETDRAFARAEAAANKTMEVYTESIAKVKEVFEAAKNGAASLFGEVDAVAKFQGQQGRAFIEGALAQVRAGGALPDGEDLSDAISAVGKDFAATQFASQAEADFQRLVVANELKGLQDASGDQLSTQEAQLKVLKDQVEWARQQVDALRGIDSAVRDLPTAIAELILAYNTEEVTRKGGRPATLLGSGGASFDTTTGTGRTSSGTYFNAAAIADAAAAVLAANPGAAGVGSILDALQGQGFSMAEYNEMFNLPPGTLEAEAKALGKPIYHTGTTYVPETGFALLQKGEAVIPTAYNPWANGAMGGGSDGAVVAELRLLRDDHRAQAGQIIRLQTQVTKLLNQWNVEGLPEERELTV